MLPLCPDLQVSQNWVTSHSYTTLETRGDQLAIDKIVSMEAKPITNHWPMMEAVASKQVQVGSHFDLKQLNKSSSYWTQILF